MKVCSVYLLFHISHLLTSFVIQILSEYVQKDKIIELFTTVITCETIIPRTLREDVHWHSNYFN